MDSFVYEPILQENTYVCAFASAHTYNLFVYMHILTSTRMLYHKYFVYDPDVVQTYVYLCPFESSRLEPHVSIHIFTSIHVSFFDTLVYEPKYCNSHLFVPLLVLTLESSLYTCIYIFTSQHISCYLYIYMSKKHVVRTHVCLFPCEGSHLEPLCIHTYAHKYTYIMSQIRLYINPCCALSHLFVPLRVFTLRASLYTCIHSQVYICHITDAFVYDLVLCKLTCVSSLARAHT